MVLITRRYRIDESERVSIDFPGVAKGEFPRSVMFAARRRLPVSSMISFEDSCIGYSFRN